jgi:hypothetical protein
VLETRRLTLWNVGDDRRVIDIDIRLRAAGERGSSSCAATRSTPASSSARSTR